jgi:hypothetical protein
VAAARRLGHAAAPGTGGDALAVWAERTGHRRTGQQGCGRLRFAFYGRVSTEDHQDPVTSLARQREQAAALVAGQGQIVAEFLDIGQSRTRSWAGRPQAAALGAALVDPERGWDAIVIGEYERAFYGSQYAAMAPLFEHYGIQLWTRKSAAGSTPALRITSRRCWPSAISRSARLPAPRSGSARRWPPRPESRAATSAAAHPTATGSLMPGRTRTRLTPPGPARAPAGTRPGHPTGRGVDVRPAAGRAQRRADHPGPQ